MIWSQGPHATPSVEATFAVASIWLFSCMKNLTGTQIDKGLSKAKGEASLGVTDPSLLWSRLQQVVLKYL